MKNPAAACVFTLAVFLAAAAPLPPGKPAPARPVKTAAKTPVKTAIKPAAKAAPKPAPKTANAPDLSPAKTYPLQTIAFPGGVTMTQMVYRSLPGFRPLTLDLYLPPGKGFPRPGLVFVHGGGWNSGDPRHAGTFGDFPGLLATIAGRGFVVASVDYRLSGEARFPAPLQDVKSAIRWLRGHASDTNLDETRIAIWGVAAGGQLAALAGVSCGVTSLEPDSDPPDGDRKDKPPSDCVQAVIDWYGTSDFETMAADLGKPAPDKSTAGDYLGCEPALCAVGVARNASPLAYIESMSPPFLIQHGADDTDVSSKQSQKLYDALRAKDVPAELVIYPGVGHDFTRSVSGGSGVADPATNSRAVEKLEGFLDASFPKKPATSPYKPAKRKGLPY
jgi:acetyl esterase/lipase